MGSNRSNNQTLEAMWDNFAQKQVEYDENISLLPSAQHTVPQCPIWNDLSDAHIPCMISWEGSQQITYKISYLSAAGVFPWCYPANTKQGEWQFDEYGVL